jgi:threonine/homoserine/homoserine lactone efflux protein
LVAKLNESMFGIHDFWLFYASALLLAVAPGPDTAYIVGRSVQMGWRGGAAATFGVTTGCLVHVFAAAIGLSALLAASSTAFMILKWLGAAYLCYIGVTMLFSRAPAWPTEAATERSEVPLGKVFWQGALTNIFNPKVALFFLAFLPQFVAAEAPHKAIAFILLGLIIIFNGTLWCLGVAAFTARTASRVRKSPRAVLWTNRVLGGTFVFLGARLAMIQAK